MSRAVRMGMFLLLGCAALAGCGTTTGLRRNPALDHHDLGRYAVVSIGAFAADTPDSYTAARQFPVMIQEALSRYELTQQVVVGARRSGALHVDGAIERYRESNVLFRYVGFGARFDATVRISDGASGALFGTMHVNRDSSPLGGVQAITEDGDHHLRQAAVRVADEVVLALGIEPFWLRERACVRQRCSRPGYRGTR